MRIIFLSTDRNLLTPQSAVSLRFARFAARFPHDSFESIVFSTRAHGLHEPVSIAPNMRAYPTNSYSRLFYGLDALRIAKTLIRPDIISSQDPFETGLLAFFVSRHFRVPFVIEVHTDFLLPDFIQNSFLNRLRVILANFVFAKARGGYAVSARVRDSLIKRYALATSFEVLPIFVDTVKFATLPHNTQKGELLWIGRLTQEKDPVVAIEALAQARAGGHTVQLTILGQGPLELSLRSRAKELSVEPFVRFEGWQDPAPYISNAELLLVTSRYEGYGMALVEALAAGVPVVATDVGIAREAGAIIASRGEFADALCLWLNGPRNRGVLQLPGYQSEEEYFERTIEFYTNHLV